jgi:hypothetical protein
MKLIMYGHANGSGQRATHICQQMFPQQCLSNHRTFSAFDPQLRGTGTFKPSPSIGEDRSVQTSDIEECVPDCDCQHETNSDRVKCCIHDSLKSIARAVAAPKPQSQAFRTSSPRLCVGGLLNNMLSLPFICQCSFQMRQVYQRQLHKFSQPPPVGRG